MTKSLLPLGLAAMIAIGGAAFAQDAETPAPAPAEAADTVGTPAAEDAPADLNMGVTLNENGEVALQVGQPYVREEFGDWALRCVKTPEGEDDPCQLYQLLMDEDGNAVAEINMFPLAGESQAKAGATIVVPLETLLTEPLRLSVDGGAARAYPYSFCNRAGCVARVGFTQADVDGFKAGAAGQLTLVPAAAPDQKVNLKISLSGFTAGFSASDSQ
ncbi:MAG: invasion-associated locus B family protein [Rhodobacterales bacterium]|nr:MAG: invasion-associated locus B family protein [Rhodobacterales bacterium]